MNRLKTWQDRLFASKDDYVTRKVLQWLRGDLALWEACMDAAEACLALASGSSTRAELRLAKEETCICPLARALRHIALKGFTDEPVDSLFALLVREDSRNIDWDALAERVLAALSD